MRFGMMGMAVILTVASTAMAHGERENRGLSPIIHLRSVLSRVGITTVTGKNYTQQFGITLATHRAVGIDEGKSSNLMAATGLVLSETPDGPDLNSEQEAQLWAEAQPLFEQLKHSPEEIDAMWIPTIRDAGLLASTVAAVVAAAPVQATDNYVLGRCKISSPDSGAEIRPIYAADSYLTTYHRNDPRYKGFTFDGDDAKVTLVKAPAHGRIVLEEGQWAGNADYHYWPEAGYVGKDRFVMQVEKNGVKVRIQYLIESIDNETPTSIRDDDGTRALFCNPEQWKISSAFTTPALDNLALQSLLDAAGINNSVTVTTADLSGGAVGQTTGTTITLDSNAAGYGWYIDYTPYLNDEYLPTSNPNLWVAKAGNEAAGKMDMLSVLLHEYGHALGLEHSADGGDYMAATLQPGVRRMPSSEELALMARLVAGVKANYGSGISDEVPAPNAPVTPREPGVPTPNRGHHAVRTTRARISRFGTTILNADGSESQSPQDATRYAIVANPTLTDAKLQTGTGWESTGSVAIGNGTALLTETTRSQTRLNQVFLVGPNDRYLTFTLTNIGLDDVDNGPDDAFEVALLNANTGSVLTGATGLTRNDAFLNLQANGTEHLGQGVTSTRNADGSRTYRLDLAGIPVGTAVNLSFDLIGFGGSANATSHVTVRDMRLGVPETRDDTASTAEDSPVDIAALANDVDANQAGFTPVVVTGPAHGNVSLNADGSFHYVPLADWNGEDSFTYKLSDGSVDSNVATVRITVTAVNDAPIVANRSASTDEDTALTVDLLAGASDKVACRHG